MVMKKSYDKMAPNAGYGHSSEPMHKAARKVAEDHGMSMDLSSKQHIASNTTIHDWDGMAYSQGQDGNGSMNYMSEKKAIASEDAKKLSRSRKADVER